MLLRRVDTKVVFDVKEISSTERLGIFKAWAAEARPEEPPPMSLSMRPVSSAERLGIANACAAVARPEEPPPTSLFMSPARPATTAGSSRTALINPALGLTVDAVETSVTVHVEAGAIPRTCVGILNPNCACAHAPKTTSDKEREKNIVKDGEEEKFWTNDDQTESTREGRHQS